MLFLYLLSCENPTNCLFTKKHKQLYLSNNRWYFLMELYGLDKFVINFPFSADKRLILPDMMERIFCMILLDSND